MRRGVARLGCGVVAGNGHVAVTAAYPFIKDWRPLVPSVTVGIGTSDPAMRCRRSLPEPGMRANTELQHHMCASQRTSAEVGRGDCGMAAYSHFVGHGPVVVIGAVLLGILIGATVAAVVRAGRRRHEAASLTRCWGLITEALIVRQRISGQIDAATYQARMKDLVSGRHSQRVGAGRGERYRRCSGDADG